MADGKVDGTSGADTIISGYVDGDGDTAGTGPDLIYGYGGADSINGWLGVDTIYGGSGDDTIKGGNGIFDDLLYGGAGNDSFWGQAGNDTLYGGTGQDTLEGDTGDDVLYIASGDDDIYGGMNNDLLIVELGTSAWVDGESGDDTLDFAALTGTTVSSVNYYGGSTVDGYVMFANGERMEFRRVEALHNIGDGTVDGTAGNDSMVSGYTDGSYDAIGGSDGSHQDYIMGYAGNDTIAAGSGDDTVYGGAGTDSLFGGLGNDGLFGGSGDDILDGNEGSDTLHSGAGNDTYLGGTGQDYIDFGAETSGVLVDLNSGTLGGAAAGDVINSGIDGIFGTNFDDTISGFDPFSLSGDIYTNIFYGRGGNDLLAGCGGPDELYGGSGDDTFLMADAPGNDTIVGGETGADNDTIDFSALTSGINATYSSTEAGTVISGADTVSFSEVETLTLTDLADTVTGSAGAETISGGGGADSLTMNGGADVVTGGLGADTIYGGAGSDSLYGGAGIDSIFGGTGNDSLYAQSGDDIIYGNSGDDYVTVSDANNYAFYGGEDPGDTDYDILDISALGGAGQVTSIIYDTPDKEDGTIFFLNGNSATFAGFEQIVCFARGTRLMTETGYRRIETIRPGDRLMTRDNGPQPVAWIGRKRVAARGDAAPILLRPGMWGATRPLKVSPQHRLLFSGWQAEVLFGEPEVLLAAKHLVDDRRVLRKTGDSVVYFHVCLPQHEVLLADGVAAESFLPGDIGRAALAPDQLERLMQALPDLRRDITGMKPARPILKGFEARALLDLVASGAKMPERA